MQIKMIVQLFPYRTKLEEDRILVDVLFGNTGNQTQIYMDSYTEKGNIISNFRLGMLITILKYKNKYHQLWSDIETRLCK